MRRARLHFHSGEVPTLAERLEQKVQQTLPVEVIGALRLQGFKAFFDCSPTVPIHLAEGLKERQEPRRAALARSCAVLARNENVKAAPPAMHAMPIRLQQERLLLGELEIKLRPMPRSEGGLALIFPTLWGRARKFLRPRQVPREGPRWVITNVCSEFLATRCRQEYERCFLVRHPNTVHQRALRVQMLEDHRSLRGARQMGVCGPSGLGVRFARFLSRAVVLAPRRRFGRDRKQCGGPGKLSRRVLGGCHERARRRMRRHG
mmetsp:Transcript_57835/g.161431  ORF Transcript_57835/g.161431 Transcript_57835/m.161431 type:complete len:262 (-) Transcript_57835:251-1036(-)